MYVKRKNLRESRHISNDDHISLKAWYKNEPVLDFLGGLLLLQ